jgi:polyhydroxybutyrate depolymerase
MYSLLHFFAVLAQLVERLLAKQKAAGSRPAYRTNKIRFILFTCLIILTSCGGGGSSNSSETNSNDPGQDINLNTEICSNTNRDGLLKCDLKHDNRDRFYYLYTPENLDSNESIPVLFALHGYGSSASRHLNYTNYFPIADTNNFIVVYPQGSTTATLSSHWNVGGWTSKSTVKDIEFIDTIISLVKAKIQIDETRIYSSGMSNGGYMSYHLICNLSEKFAAIASVTGSMTNGTYDNCTPLHPMPVLQIHGLQDFVVPYIGNSGSKSIPDVIDYWVNYNSCKLEPNQLIKYSNNYDLIIYDTYENCLNNVNVKLILHPEMDHTWPTLQEYSVSASNEIWNFVSQYDLYGLIE